jgi:hypothetical protein
MHLVPILCCVSVVVRLLDLAHAEGRYLPRRQPVSLKSARDYSNRRLAHLEEDLFVELVAFGFACGEELVQKGTDAQQELLTVSSCFRPVLGVLTAEAACARSSHACGSEKCEAGVVSHRLAGRDSHCARQQGRISTGTFWRGEVEGAPSSPSRIGRRARTNCASPSWFE